MEETHDRLADPGQRALRPRHGANPVTDDAGISVDEHLEQLFAALGMVGQRPVDDTERGPIVSRADVVQHPGAVERPESEMSNQHGHIRADVDGRPSGEGLHPPEVEVLPARQ